MMEDYLKRAIIIAAGEGKRLRPVTEKTPKPLVKINGIRIIDTIINALKDNGVQDIYIIVGYKKEKFEEVYGGDPGIHLLYNPYYLDGNNITSMYVARKYLPGSYVIEGDIMINNKGLLSGKVKESCYCVENMELAPEWSVKTEKGHIVSCNISGAKNAGRLWGISMWTIQDGEALAELIRQQFEEKKDWNIYWDEIALMKNLSQFKIGVREIHENDLAEIDTVRELAELDPSYLAYC